ncbi:ABC transporter ATP-binding protein [Halorhabdus sp. CUG00001]|uniref:ABC transporter ATP-binding protein n=1 Tax=Halorhabdus sp. CUG00001 TaxID=2600297 RepID=UPI00131CAAC4
MGRPPHPPKQASTAEAPSSRCASDDVGKNDEGAALAVDGLSKTFGSGEEAVTAVEDVSFAVEPGEVVGLLGPNGAGKTTTIKSILGLVVPDTGDVRIQGIDVYDRPRRAYEHVDAMLEGARNDYWRLTVRENLRYFAAIRGHDPDTLDERHTELLAALEIEAKADTQVRELSRGMKQKVSLASVLASDVSVAFLDEPTLGLDIESSMTIRRELVRLAEERDLTLLVSSHDMDVIEAVCDRVIIMNDGRIIVDDTVQNLLEEFETTGYRVTARDIADTTIDTLCADFDVTAVERLGDRTAFEVAADSATFYRLMDRLEAADVQLAGVETVQPDLDEVFLEVTGNGHGTNGAVSPVGGGRPES